VVAANAPWLIVPVLVVWRVARSPHLFTRDVALAPSAGAA
jgi:hypothetical protein